LYGGTAIALRLGHRTSVDFDFFSERPLDRDAMHGALPFLANATAVQDRQDSLTVLVPCDDPQHGQVKVSFFGGIDFGRVGEPDLTDDGVLQVASLDDLMATTLKVILRRVEAKDYRDIAAMLNAGADLPRGWRRPARCTARTSSRSKREGAGVLPGRRSVYVDRPRKD